VKSRGWFRVHSWIGIVAGLLLFVVCWSGTVATLSDEIDWLLNPAIRVTAGNPVSDQASWEEIYDSVERSFPDAEVQWLDAALHDGFAKQVVVRTQTGQRLRVYVDPMTARVQGSTTYFNVHRFFRSFHMGLFLVYPVGTYLVCAFGVILLISTIAPLLFFKRWWTRFFTLHLGNGARALWSGLHKLSGLWSLWFGLLIALTGIWYLAEQASVDIADAQFAYPPLPPWQKQTDGEPLPLDDLVSRARELRPDLEIRSISFYRDDASYGVMFCGQAGHLLVRNCANKLYLDAFDGRVITDESANQIGPLRRLVHTADPLHFGDFSGLVSQVIWFVFGLVLSGLCLTGAYLHAARLVRESRSRHSHWPGTTAAIAVSALVLAASLYSGMVEVRNYGAPVDEGIEWPAIPNAVSAFILLWILTTVVILWFWARLVPLARKPAISACDPQA
jgi:uncharacterized iron-regulated membrane protein